MSIVKRDHLCFNCLGHHNIVDCKSTKTCRNCQKRHHTSLCKDSAQNSRQDSVNVGTVQHNAKYTDNILHSQAPATVLLKTAINPVSSGQQCLDANILFDEGAQRSFVTEEFATKLNLVTSGTESVNLSGFGDSAESTKIRHLKTAIIYLITKQGNKIPIRVLVVPEIAAPLTTYIHKAAKLRYLSGVTLAHPVTANDSFEVSVLIGADYYWSIVENHVIRGKGPTAVKSKIGYLLSGPLHYETSDKNERTSMMNVMISRKTDEYDLERFWKIEGLGVEKTEEPKTETIEFQKQYEDTCITYKDNRYYATLPWKEDHPVLPVNREIAKRGTESVIKRLSKEPELLHKYGELIAEQERRKFIEKVETSETGSNLVHYIPHHPVKKDSTTTPIRIVFDCSCRPTPDTPSLNDCLMSTPPELNDLTGILLRFRLHRFAVTTDIEKAFLNVGLEDKDRDVTRFFWFQQPTDPSSNLTTYRFRAVLFGATCSPFILNAVLQKHLKENPCDWTEILQKDLYVDNIISSFPTEEALLKYFDISRALFAKAGFNLRSWASNTKKLQNRAASQNVLDKENLIKVLGLRWNTTRDTLTFAQPEHFEIDNNLVTKREILRQSSKIYDPLGIISPITGRSKMLMQSLWEKKFDWDEPLPSDIMKGWTEIQRETRECIKTEIPRTYFTGTESTEDMELHVFTDASLKAYGACAYSVHGNQSSLLMSRNRVAPLKQLTIPKLELMAAVIGARLLKHLKTFITVSHITLWSDSQIALSWLNSTKKLPAFVQNRVTEINEITQEYEWRYCPTDSNPADLISRGMTAMKFKNCQLWMNGLKWLIDIKKWPQWNSETLVSTTLTENALLTIRKDKPNTTETELISNVIEVDRYGSYQKLLRVTAYM